MSHSTNMQNYSHTYNIMFLQLTVALSAFNSLYLLQNQKSSQLSLDIRGTTPISQSLYTASHQVQPRPIPEQTETSSVLSPNRRRPRLSYPRTDGDLVCPIPEQTETFSVLFPDRQRPRLSYLRTDGDLVCPISGQTETLSVLSPNRRRPRLSYFRTDGDLVCPISGQTDTSSALFPNICDLAILTSFRPSCSEVTWLM